MTPEEKWLLESILFALLGGVLIGLIFYYTGKNGDE